MKGIRKKIVCGLLSAVMLILAACGNAAKETNAEIEDKTDTGSAGKGRYLETELALPKGTDCVFAMRRLADGMIRMVTNVGIFDSSDDGKTFALSKLPYPAERYAKDRENITEVEIDSQGRIYMAYFYQGCRMVDLDGKETELEIDIPNLKEKADDNFIQNIKMTKDDKMVIQDDKTSIYVFDRVTGKTKKILDKAEYLADYAVIGNQLIILTSAGPKAYNVENGKKEEPAQAIQSYFAGIKDKGILNDYYSDKMIPDKDNIGCYYGDYTGLYRYTAGAGEMEMLINGSYCAMSNPRMIYQEIIQKNDDGFLILYWGEPDLTLKDYTYSKEVSAVPEKELKIYTLRDSQALRQAINGFQTANPEYYLSLEVGMPIEEKITEEDAVKSLEANIGSGNGADIIVLDGLPRRSYEEKGVLADITAMVKNVQKNGRYFENILNANQADGKVYAVPTRFALPVIGGAETDVEAVKGLDTLAARVKKLRADNPKAENIMGGYYDKELTNFILKLSLPDILQQDDTTNEAALTRYMKALKSIYDADQEKDIRAGIDDNLIMAFGGLGLGAEYLSIQNNLDNLLINDQKLYAGCIKNVNEFSVMHTVMKQKNWTYKPLTGSAEQVLFPIDTLGINAKSTKSEDAQKFIKYVLSQEQQLPANLTGLPVNRDALEKACENEEKVTMSWLSKEGEDTQQKTVLGSKADRELFYKCIEAVTTASDINDLTTDAIAKKAAVSIRKQ